MSKLMGHLAIQKNLCNAEVLVFVCSCGKRGIRTPGTSLFNGFQDRRIRPLCHLSNRMHTAVTPADAHHLNI